MDDTLRSAGLERWWGARALWLAPILVCGLAGCGSTTVSPDPSSAGIEVHDAATDLAHDDSLPDLPDAAHEFSLPPGEDGPVEFLAASVKASKADCRLPFLATCRIEQGGNVTTGSIVHCSPRNGTYILSCRHGRDKGGPWVARCSGGAMLYGEKYVISKDSDLCLLVAKGQYDLGYVRPVPLRKTPLPATEPCLSIGYDNPLGGGKFSNEAGDAPRPWTDKRPENWSQSADGHPLILVHTPSGPGRSGGGLFIVSSSELIGVCSFRDAMGVNFVGRKSLLAFLNRCQGLGHVPWWQVIDLAPKAETPQAGTETPKEAPKE